LGRTAPRSGRSSGRSGPARGVRVAACPAARVIDVLAVLNAARDVTKTSTCRVQMFVSRHFGILACADADLMEFYRKLLRRAPPHIETATFYLRYHALFAMNYTP